MKKFIFLFVLGASIAVIPLRVHASFLGDFVNWLLPSTSRPEPITQEGNGPGVGGISINADPALASGDSSRAYTLPAGSHRSFTITNGSTLDLFLNKSQVLSYSAVPAFAPGDVPNAYALALNTSRIVTITNPSFGIIYNLSKTDLSVLSATTTLQSSIFVSNAKSESSLIDNGSLDAMIASLTFNFTINNATNKDIYVSKLINPFTLATLLEVPGAKVQMKFVESTVASIAGDGGTVFVIPAGTDREFELTGIIDNTKGIMGSKVIGIRAINYSNSPDLSTPRSIIDAAQLRNLSSSLTLGSGELKRATPAISTAVVTPSAPPPPITSANPPVPTVAPLGTPASSPEISPSISPKTSPTPSESASSSISPVSPLLITSASTKIGSPIIENGEVVGYPVTFIFTAEARDTKIYISKNPATAFVTSYIGFGKGIPVINNIFAIPATLPESPDGAGYYTISERTSRTFNAFVVLRSDGATAGGSKIFQITKINYGTSATSLKTSSTLQNTANMKAIVKLAPRSELSATPAPSSSVTPNPSLTPLPSVDPNFSIICYATPPSPIKGQVVYWQVALSGGTPPYKYSWSGSDNLSGATYLLSKTYSTSGRKDAAVSVSTQTQTKNANCNVDVSSETYIPPSSPTPTPSSSPSASPSSSPSGDSGGDIIPPTSSLPPPPPSPQISGSPVSVNSIPAQDQVANILSALAEFLDSFFR